MLRIQISTDEAIEYAGNKNRLAKLLDIQRQSLTTWGGFVPQTSAWKLYLLSNKELGVVVNEDIEKKDRRRKTARVSENDEAEVVQEEMSKAEIYSLFNRRG